MCRRNNIPKLTGLGSPENRRLYKLISRITFKRLEATVVGVGVWLKASTEKEEIVLDVVLVVRRSSCEEEDWEGTMVLCCPRFRAVLVDEVAGGDVEAPESSLLFDKDDWNCGCDEFVLVVVAVVEEV